LKEKAEAIRQGELKKTLPNLGQFSPAQLKALETMTISITEKMINDPILLLKKKAERSTRELYLDVARKLFNLDQELGEDEDGHQQDDRDPERTS
jgi:glutamyl-tRNA reductase